VVDGHGTVLPKTDQAVTFTVEGPGKLVGENPVVAEAGVASILLVAGREAGVITVSAGAAAVEGVRGTVRSAAD
jgi:beta-galactosidase